MAGSTGWNELIVGLPGAHVLQTSNWGETKARFGWSPKYYLWIDTNQGISNQIYTPELTCTARDVKAAVLILSRKIKLAGYSVNILYTPKGPMLDWSDNQLRNKVLSDIVRIAISQSAIFIKIDPDLSLGSGFPGQEDFYENSTGMMVQTELQHMGWVYSNDQIQFRNTMLIDLVGSEDEILAAMKSKTRYNVRLAERKGVTIRDGTTADIHLLYQMYAETSIRDGFVIRSLDYYQAVWGKSWEKGLAEFLIAEADGKPVAGLILFIFGPKAFYLYGMSTQDQREKMPNYLLQWEAIKRAKRRGCKIYDLWGAPETSSEDDPLWGVYRFKEGLGGTVLRGLGAWDLPLKPTLYKFYTRTLPRVLDLMRWRGKKQTRQQLGA